MAGGFEDAEPLRLAEIYDPNSDTWSPLPPMKTCRGGVAIISVGNRVLAIGGHNGAKYLESVEMLCSACLVDGEASPTSSKRNSRQEERGDTSNKEDALKVCEKPAADASPSPPVNEFDLIWTKMPSMGTERAGAGVGVISNHAFPFHTR